MQQINKKEKTVFEALDKFYAKYKKMPSIRELQKAVNNLGLLLKSSRSILVYLNKLEEKGLIRRNTETRVIEIINSSKTRFVEIPIYGGANCGVASIFAEQYFQGTLKISKRLLGDNTKDVFAIQASGNSMNDYKVSGKKIEDGDYVLVDSKYEPSVGDKNVPVLAVIDGVATIKILRYLDNTIGLFPQSKEKKFLPIYLTLEDDFVINGKVIDVLKS